MNKLEPCPFCGKEIEVLKDEKMELVTLYHPANACVLDEEEFTYGDMSVALRYWNRRPSQWINVEDELPVYKYAEEMRDMLSAVIDRVSTRMILDNDQCEYADAFPEMTRLIKQLLSKLEDEDVKRD